MEQLSLGETLKISRENMGLTLRQVEEAVSVSNSYLSQLENNKIKMPSANVLYKLASLYKISLDTLLIASGIIKEENRILKDNGMIAFSPPVTTEEERALLDYLNYLRYKNRRS